MKPTGRNRSRALVLLLLLLGGSLSAAGCNLVLGLGDYKDACPEVEQGKDCPDAGALCHPGETTACYDGPAGTEGAGICHGGTMTCGSNGLYGRCEGEQLPKEAEVCGNGIDEDCNGMVDDHCPCTPGKKYACYAAKNQSTKGVGNCKAGEAVCEADGVSMGTCVGDVVPTEENYEKKGDENCDGIPSADLQWVKILTIPSGIVETGGIAADSEGNTFVAGLFVGTLQLGASTIMSASEDEAAGFIAKLDAGGDWLWLKSMGTAFVGTPAVLYSSNSVLYDEKRKRVIVAGTAAAGADIGAPGGPL